MNRTVTPPAGLQQLLDQYPAAARFFGELSFSHKREYVEWILSAKRAETLEQRLTVTIEKLLEGKKSYNG
ncbi:MAG: YdeI/OmpD-associated family protein [Ferruginibacter sp.]